MSADLVNRDLGDTRLPVGIEIELLRDDASLRHYEARQAGEPVGVVSAFTVQPTLLLTELAVEPHARRQGIGRALVLHALRDGSSRGCRLALLDPTPATVPFYEALGFALERFPPGRNFYLP
jgi:GNAT superfamily N-acetyltransferase